MAGHKSMALALLLALSACAAVNAANEVYVFVTTSADFGAFGAECTVVASALPALADGRSTPICFSTSGKSGSVMSIRLPTADTATQMDVWGKLTNAQVASPALKALVNDFLHLPCGSVLTITYGNGNQGQTDIPTDQTNLWPELICNPGQVPSPSPPRPVVVASPSPPPPVEGQSPSPSPPPPTVVVSPSPPPPTVTVSPSPPPPVVVVSPSPPPPVVFPSPSPPPPAGGGGGSGTIAVVAVHIQGQYNTVQATRIMLQLQLLIGNDPSTQSVAYNSKAANPSWSWTATYTVTLRGANEAQAIGILSAVTPGAINNAMGLTRLNQVLDINVSYQQI